MTTANEWELIDLGLSSMPGLALAVRRQRDGSCQPRVISQPPGAVVFAAAWCDRTGQVVEWLELWVQDPSSWWQGEEQSIWELTNRALDAQWRGWLDAMTASHPGRVLHFDFDRHPAPVVWLDGTGGRVHQQSGQWELCTADGVLADNRLAAYATSLHRYLWNRDAARPRFLALTPGAPEGPATAQVEEVFGDAHPVNPGGALMALVRSFSLPLADFADRLANLANSAPLKQSLRNPQASARLLLLEGPGGATTNRGFFFQRSLEPGHLGEVLHLKLSVLHGCLVAVANAVRHAGCPFLGLDADSFAVSLPEVEPALPFLWAHEVALVAPPQCVATHIGDLGEPCFLPSPGLRQSVFRSSLALSDTRGQARVRLRSVSAPDDEGLVVIEGTLATEEPLPVGRLDLLVMEWLLPKLGRLRLYCRIEGKLPGGGGEYRFRSLQSKLAPQVLAWLDAEKGTLTADRVPFHLLPRVGTPGDLYALGVVALRILLHHPDGLAATLDDLLSLARAYRTRHSDGNWGTGMATLHDFVKTGEGGPAADRLHPRWLCPDHQMAAEALQQIPAALWWNVIEFVCRLFPGEVADSFCKNHEDFQPRAPHEVFTAPIAALDTLLVRSRELLFGNPLANREIRHAIRQVMHLQ